MKSKQIISTILILTVLLLMNCKKEDKEVLPPNTTNTDTTINTTSIYGYSILSKIGGIWKGPVTTSTSLGNLPEWILDARAISKNQISGRSDFDKINSIELHFFPIAFNNTFKICFKNGGLFNGMTRYSYFFCDSVVETSNFSFYRFSEVIQGTKKAYTTFEFKEDSLIMKSYTNKNNTLPTAVLHQTWSSKKYTNEPANQSAQSSNFPQQKIKKDFSSTFINSTESTYYSSSSDPDPTEAYPYLSKLTITYTLSGANPSNKSFVFLTLKPLFNGSNVDWSVLDTKPRSTFVSANENSCTFNQLHPGRYYVYVIYDSNNDAIINSGDQINLMASEKIILPLSHTTENVNVNYTLP